MTRHPLALATAAATAALGVGALTMSPAKDPSSVPVAVAQAGLAPPARAAWAERPLVFEANVGQVDPRARFVARSGEATIFFTDEGPVISMPRTSVAHADQPAWFRMRLVGAPRHLSVRGLQPLDGKVNSFTGNDRSAWRTEVPTYARVEYPDVYPGIRLVFRGTGRQLEYDFVVAPGADPDAIRLSFEGADGESEGLEVDPAGNLQLTVAGSTATHHRPDVYQEGAGRRLQLQGSYAKVSKTEVAFALPAYDRRQRLVIDPVLSYSSYLGGSASDTAYGVAVDSAGNTYLAGSTASANFPTANPLQGIHDGGVNDAFVSKLNPSGTALVYSTYLGGSGNDVANAIAVDDAGSAYVAGMTTSANFPTANPAQATFDGGPYDAFVAKLSASGSTLVYSTYLGGTADDGAYGIAVNGSGHAYVAGTTYSADWPTANALQATFDGGLNDAFVAQLSADGTALLCSTFLGGSGNDVAYGIALDSASNAYVAGVTKSPNFPTVGAIQTSLDGGQDAFAAKLNASCSALAYSTYLGGGNVETAYGVAVDSLGFAYVVGQTFSSTFPTAYPLQAAHAGGGYDAFVSKLAPSGTSLAYSTFLGGGAVDIARGVAVDHDGNAYVGGYTASGDFPTADPAQAGFAGGSFDAFVSVLNASGSAFVSSTFLGGSGVDVAYAVAVDALGTATLAGNTTSTDLPDVNALQSTLDGGFDVLVSRLSPPPSDAGSTDGGAPDVDAGPDEDAGSTPVDGGTGSQPGCGCQGSGAPAGAFGLWAVLALALIRRRGLPRASHRDHPRRLRPPPPEIFGPASGL